MSLPGSLTRVSLVRSLYFNLSIPRIFPALQQFVPEKLTVAFLLHTEPTAPVPSLFSSDC